MSNVVAQIVARSLDDEAAASQVDAERHLDQLREHRRRLAFDARYDSEIRNELADIDSQISNAEAELQ